MSSHRSNVSKRNVGLAGRLLWSHKSEARYIKEGSSPLGFQIGRKRKWRRDVRLAAFLFVCCRQFSSSLYHLGRCCHGLRRSDDLGTMPLNA